MSETIPYMRVEAPALGQPQRGGLLDHPDLISVISDPHLGGGVEYRPRLDCSPVGLAPGMCNPADLDVDAEKKWTEPTLNVSPAFAVYKGAGCYIIGEPYDEQARAGLELGEGAAVAKAFNALLRAGTFGITASVPDAPACTEDAVGLMEDAIGEFAVGGGVMLTSRRGATWMLSKSLARWEGTELVTALGTPLVAEAGFGLPPTGAAPAGVYLYGVVNPRFYKGSNVIQVSGRDLATNESIAIAERLWSISTECTIAQVVLPSPCTTS